MWTSRRGGVILFLLRKVIPLDDHPFSDLCYPLNPQPSYLLGAKLKNSATRFQIIPLCNVSNAKTLKVSLYFHLLTTSYILHSVFHTKRNKTRRKEKKKKDRKTSWRNLEEKEKWQGINYAWYKFHEGKFADRTLTTGERERIRCLLKFKRTLTRLAVLFPSNFDGTMVMVSAGWRKYDQAEWNTFLVCLRNRLQTTRFLENIGEAGGSKSRVNLAFIGSRSPMVEWTRFASLAEEEEETKERDLLFPPSKKFISTAFLLDRSFGYVIYVTDFKTQMNLQCWRE